MTPGGDTGWTKGGAVVIQWCCSGAHQQLVLEGMDSTDQGQAVPVGGPGVHHEEGRLNGRHDAVHQHPVELQDCALLPPQILLEQQAKGD